MDFRRRLGTKTPSTVPRVGRRWVRRKSRSPQPGARAALRRRSGRRNSRDNQVTRQPVGGLKAGSVSGANGAS